MNGQQKREPATINYQIRTNSIKENIVTTLTDKQIQFIYATEVDSMNIALFGKTAGEWRKENPSLKVNIIDYTELKIYLSLQFKKDTMLY